MDKNKDILEAFQSNVDSVARLSEFDEMVIGIAIKALTKTRDWLVDHQIDNPLILPDNALTQLQNIHENQSLQIYYQNMYNQCIVLLVAYFTSTLSDLFIANMSNFMRLKPEKMPKEDLKLSLRDIANMNFDLSEHIGELLVKKKEISFQDMQSTCKTFKKYLDIQIEKNAALQNIIFAQAARHIIVHNGGIINSSFSSQIRETKLRTIKKDATLEGKISFTPEEITAIGEDMVKFVSGLVTSIDSVEQDRL